MGRDLLLAFAFTMLALLAGHMLAYGLSGTFFYRWLFPHPFLGRGFDLPKWLEWFYDREIGANVAIINFVYARVLELWNDMYGFSKVFVMAPLLEELEWRGPLFLTRRHAHRGWWMTAAVVGAALFTLAHNSGLGTLIPVFAVALGSSWLIAKTGRFWPSLVLHAVYNMQVTFWGIAASLGSW
ncbi:MAG: CPBP family intramembrane metalloprotease [Candidatus Liptonbacteria bacterium]|nr:CPBP family intramembrane metalloprotease [Candidatus Liptonbacteria bacterium]